MRRFRRFFAWLFILSLFLGVFHTLSHDHHDQETCEVCLLAHSPSLSVDTPSFCLIETAFEPFLLASNTHPSISVSLYRNRSPPLS